MAERPVYLLCFANQQDSYLPKLKEESAKLNDTLSGLHDKGVLEVFREENVTADNLAKALNRFRNRIELFHYAGHADGERLDFVDGSGHAAGIAELLGQLPNLKLVMLNGCSTQGQVDYLLQQGVKAVIATAVPIDDSRAVEFANFFYLSLAGTNSLEDAFQFAVSCMRNKYGGHFRASIFRPGDVPVVDNPRFMPWGLFIKSEDALQFRMRYEVTTRITRPQEAAFEVNRFMVDVLEEMLIFDPSLQALIQRPGGEAIDDREALALIIEHFPWPIGVQIRLLATKDEGMDMPSVDRIRQLISTYLMLGQFVYYALLSQIWDIKRNKGFVRNRSSLTAFIYANPKSYNHFDFILGIADAVEAIEEAGQKPYIEELSDFVKAFRQQEGAYSAYQYLESLRSQVNNQEQASMEANRFQLCADGEYFLSELLMEFAFLVKYDLVTIRDIYVENYRYLHTRFNHFIGRPNAKVGDIMVGRTPRPRAFESFANNASVILTKDLQDIRHALNLSPFIIDKNAFGSGMTEDRATEQQLFIYAFRDGVNHYRYLTILHNLFRAQERPGDQFSTSEGAPASAAQPTLTGRPARPGRRSAANSDEAPPNPYAILEQQFKLLENDFLNS